MPGSVQSVERAAAIMRLLAGGHGRPLGELAGALGLSKSTVHGIVRTLVDVGFVEQDPASGDYLLAGEALAARLKPMDINEMRSRATNWVDALAARTRLSARLVVLPDAPAAEIDAGVTAHHVFSASPAPQRVEIGDRVDLAGTAEGKVLLALSPIGTQVLESTDLHVDALRSEAATGRLRDEAVATRRRGFAIALAESRADVAGLAVPVRSHGGMVVAALGIRGTVAQVLTPARDARDDVLSSLHEAARGTSHALMSKRW
jgi:DNA-binding IclR family transcriptional regulator